MLRRIMLVMLMTVTVVLAGAGTASASTTSWQCDLMRGHSVCFRIQRDMVNSPYYMHGADIMAERLTAGCTTARFYHRIVNPDGSLRAQWADNGAFNICSTIVPFRSFHWVHAGAGAWLPKGGYVQGILWTQDSGYSYSPPIRIL